MQFEEVPSFSIAIDKLGAHEELAALQNALMADPDLGDIVPGTGGARKVRMGLPGRGKRGAARKPRNRFARLAQELADFKSGKTKLKVATIEAGSGKRTIHYETYEEMKARHASKDDAAKRFKEARIDMGLSQKDMAAALRVNRRTLEGWESSRFPIHPTAEVLLQVMKAHPEIKRELLHGIRLG